MKISEIFPSINGECCLSGQGSLCTFIRTQGCNLDCQYCDTKYAQSLIEGTELSIPEIITEVKKMGNKNVTITGGEPFLQKTDLLFLVEALFKEGYNISIETNGSIEIHANRIWRCSFVMDYKLPSSGMTDEMKPINFASLYKEDFIKFVCLDLQDFAVAITAVNDLHDKKLLDAKIAFSPVFGRLKPEVLYDWMQSEILLKEIGAILSLQLHKILKVK
jgi:7-carboxy-7-deazaguanine synthase